MKICLSWEAFVNESGSFTECTIDFSGGGFAYKGVIDSVEQSHDKNSLCINVKSVKWKKHFSGEPPTKWWGKIFKINIVKEKAKLSLEKGGQELYIGLLNTNHVVIHSLNIKDLEEQD